MLINKGQFLIISAIDLWSSKENFEKEAPAYASAQEFKEDLKRSKIPLLENKPEYLISVSLQNF